MTKKVIIIDDSVTSLNLSKSKFASLGWEVYGTLSAKEGYDMIFDVAPDLIITDALMPFIGGFQLIKMIRENEKTAKIPIVVYSVLSENNAKFYIKKDYPEYFLSKNDDINELALVAEKLVQQYPLDEEYKFEILKSKFNHAQSFSENVSAPQETQKTINFSELEQKFKERYNFDYSDEKIFSDFFKTLYPILDYELCGVFPYLSVKKEKIGFLDIRDIILSPIFQNKIAKKYGVEDVVLYKKYAPNLKIFTNEEEFHSKIEFNFEYKDKLIANIVFYSKEKSKWNDLESLENIKNILHDFFKAYFINKNNSLPQKDSLGEKYLSDKFNLINKQDIQNKNRKIFVGIVSISNYSEVVSSLSGEDIDMLNLKISEKIMKCLEQNEQVVKNEEDEYSIVIQVPEANNASDRFTFIVNSLEQISYNDKSIEAFAGICDCIINNEYNIFEAQKNAYTALEQTSTTEKVVIYNATK